MIGHLRPESKTGLRGIEIVITIDPDLKDFPPLQLPPVHLPVSAPPARFFSAKDSKTNGHGAPSFDVTSPGKTGYHPSTGYHPIQMQFPGQFTVIDEAEDHPGRRKSSGFLQPMKHLSGRMNTN
jgi:hypothetical protein